jgi:hypothetical protein
MPWHDWQFWVVSLIAIVAAWIVLRMLIPAGLISGKRTKATKARLTIGGKPVDKSVDNPR